jgi:hypothetical protein
MPVLFQDREKGEEEKDRKSNRERERGIGRERRGETEERRKKERRGERRWWPCVSRQPVAGEFRLVGGESAQEVLLSLCSFFYCGSFMLL